MTTSSFGPHSAVVLEIQADADDLAGPGDTGAEPLGRSDGRRRGGVCPRPRCEAVEAVAPEEGLVVIAAEGGGVDPPTVVEEEAGAFVSGSTAADEFHGLRSCRD